MSNIGYFTTSPAMLMKRWKASTEPTTTTTSTTTTTTTCGTNTISIYARSSKNCNLGTDCVNTCEPKPIRLEYSYDTISWAPASFDVTTLTDSCEFVGTLDVTTCETELYFRWYYDGNGCWVYFEYDTNACPDIGSSENCGNCTVVESADVGTSISEIYFSICTYCEGDCCVPCCS